MELYDAVVIGDMPSHERNLLLKYCYISGIRSYSVPKISDVLLRSSDELNLFDTPLLLSRNMGLSVEPVSYTHLDVYKRQGKYIYKYGQKVKADSDDKYTLVYANGNINDSNVVVEDFDNADIKGIDGVKAFDLAAKKDSDEDNLRLSLIHILFI